MSYFSLFQSPHPVRGATGSRSCWPPSQCHFNPRTPRGVRREAHYDWSASYIISIHAPREGCDAMGGGVAWLSLYFNPRTPRGVRRAGAGCSGGGQPIFQSTHPARGATWRSLDAMEPIVISIHAPREGCDRAGTETHQSGQPISIHAPREGCDAAQPFRPQGRPQFQSTHPARGATPKSGDSISSTRISIHAPREGCDFNSWTASVYKWHFNPRTPRGVRPVTTWRR